MSDTEFNNIEKQPFQNYRLDEEKVYDKFETISLKLNKEERLKLNEAKKLLQQEKDSTCIKQVFEIGLAYVILDPKIKILIETISNNKRRNQRMGIVEVE